MCTPRAFARARPSPVRARISSRSNSARPPRTVSISRPWAVVVSAQASLRLLKPAPRSEIAAMTLRRSRVERASRSRLPPAGGRGVTVAISFVRSAKKIDEAYHLRAELTLTALVDSLQGQEGRSTSGPRRGEREPAPLFPAAGGDGMEDVDLACPL